MRTKADVIASLRGDQQFWRNLAAEVGPDRYAEPGPMGEWSFGDMAGHLLGWRRRTIARLESACRGEPEPAPPWPAGLDADANVDPVNDWLQEQEARVAPTRRFARRGVRASMPTKTWTLSTTGCKSRRPVARRRSWSPPTTSPSTVSPVPSRRCPMPS